MPPRRPRLAGDVIYVGVLRTVSRLFRFNYYLQGRYVTFLRISSATVYFLWQWKMEPLVILQMSFLVYLLKGSVLCPSYARYFLLGMLSSSIL